MTFKVVYDSDSYVNCIQFESDSFIDAARFYLTDKKYYGNYDDTNWSVTIYKNDDVIDSFS